MDQETVAKVVADRIEEALASLEQAGLWPAWITAGLELALERRRATRPKPN